MQRFGDWLLANQAKMLLRVLVWFFCLLLLGVNAQNIVRHSCGTEARFYKIASNHALNDADSVNRTTTDGVLGCIELCVQMERCKAFNYKYLSVLEALCELLPSDRTTKENDIAPKEGWNYYDTGLFSSQIGQHCRGLSYNPCYPCLCIDSCHDHLGYTCNCTTASPPLPTIYIAFETTVPGDSKKSPYNRGQDVVGNQFVTLLNEAVIASSDGRPGKVMRLYGTNAGAILGSFSSHNLNNPGGSMVSISLWLRVASPFSGYQTIFGSGKTGHYTGFLMRVYNSARYIYVRSILSNKHLTTPAAFIHDTLRDWSHVVVTCDWQSPMIRMYINGRKVSQEASSASNSASGTTHTDLIFGAGSLITPINDHWDMHIDDFTVWNNHFLTAAEVVYLMNKGFV